MVRVSNFIIAFLNCFILLLGLISVAFAVHFLLNGASNCQKALTNPLLIIGCFLFVASLLGLIGSCCRSNIVMLIYLAVMFLLILGLIAFTVFALLVTNKGAGVVFSERGYKEYKTGNYSYWLRNHFVNDKNWKSIKSCLVFGSVCTRIADHQKILSTVESGCCKPPAACGFHQKNATFWEAPTTGPAVDDPDCKAWNNDLQIMCYECDSCKAGVLANVREEWRQLAIFNAGVIAFVIVVYSLGCCARWENIRENKKMRFRGFN